MPCVRTEQDSKQTSGRRYPALPALTSFRLLPSPVSFHRIAISFPDLQRWWSSTPAPVPSRPGRYSQLVSGALAVCDRVALADEAYFLEMLTRRLAAHASLRDIEFEFVPTLRAVGRQRRCRTARRYFDQRA